jgi:uncharacterized protein (DUF3820 family)
MTTPQYQKGVFKFGKYKGMKYDDILPNNQKYCRWCAQKMDRGFLSEDLHDYLVKNGFAITSKLPKNPRLPENQTLCTRGKYKNCRFDALPDSYIKYCIDNYDPNDDGNTPELEQLIAYLKSVS